MLLHRLEHSPYESHRFTGGLLAKQTSIGLLQGREERVAWGGLTKPLTKLLGSVQAVNAAGELQLLLAQLQLLVVQLILLAGLTGFTTR